MSQPSQVDYTFSNWTMAKKIMRNEFKLGIEGKCAARSELEFSGTNNLRKLRRRTYKN